MTLAHDIAAIRKALGTFELSGNPSGAHAGLRQLEAACSPAVITRLLAALDAAEGLREALDAILDRGPMGLNEIRCRGIDNVAHSLERDGSHLRIVRDSDFDNAHAALTTYRETTK